MSLAALAASAFSTLVNTLVTQAAAETNAAATGMPAAMPMPEAPNGAYYQAAQPGGGYERLSVEGFKTISALWPQVRVAARFRDWYTDVNGGGDPRKVPGGSQYIPPADQAVLERLWPTIRVAANFSDMPWKLVQPAAPPPPAPPPPPPLVATPTEQPTTKKIPVDVSGPVSTGIDWSGLFQQGPSVAAPPLPVQQTYYAQGDTFSNSPAQASMAPAGTPWSTYAMYAALGVGVLYMLKDMGASVSRGRGRGRRRR